jgi:hypothetical protein
VPEAARGAACFAAAAGDATASAAVAAVAAILRFIAVDSAACT